MCCDLQSFDALLYRFMLVQELGMPFLRKKKESGDVTNEHFKFYVIIL